MLLRSSGMAAHTAMLSNPTLENGLIQNLRMSYFNLCLEY